MTNGEKMQEVFPEGETRKCRDGVVFESDGWCHAYNSDWWNAEHKEPTTKNNLAVDCIDRAQAQTEIEMNAFRYTLAKERGGMGQVEWSDLLIKVSDAVDIIRNLPSVTPRPCEDAVSRQEVLYLIADNDLSMGQVVRGIHALPSVTPQEPRWIPVSERMPEENRTVIASTKHGVYSEARYTKEDGWEWAYESGADYWEEIGCNVLAWMPLPEPYKAESEEAKTK